MGNTRKGRKPAPLTGTSEQILDLAESLIQTRGYHAFSYHDIAESLGIRTASIHYYFRSKTDLGIAVVDRYASRFSAALDTIGSDPAASSMTMFERYVKPYQEFGRTSDKVCLCGALAGEMMALPDALRARVDEFFRQHQTWLAKILRRGAERGEFVLSSPPRKAARLVFGALQGALLVKRTTGDVSQLDDVIFGLKAQLAS